MNYYGCSYISISDYCPKLSDPANGRVQFLTTPNYNDNYPSLTVAMYTCTTGYMPMGATKQTCGDSNSDGDLGLVMWSGSSTMCERMYFFITMQ